MSLMIAGLCALDGTQRKNNHTAFGGTFRATQGSQHKRSNSSREAGTAGVWRDSRTGVASGGPYGGYGSEWRNLVKDKMATSLGPHTVI